MGEQKEMTAAEMAASENYPVNKGIGYPASSVQEGRTEATDRRG